jgi:hypothetical protein
MSDEIPSLSQVEEHVREHYLAHLPARLAQLRQHYATRQWRRLKLECEKLAHGAEKHGLPELAALALEAVRHIPIDADVQLTYTLDDESRITLGELLQWTG